MRQYEPRGYWGSLHASGEDLRVVGYPTLPLAFNRWLYANTAAAVRRALRRSGIDVRNSSVLDIGSGTGFWLDFWRAEGAREVAGADLVPDAVERLRRRFPNVEVTQADVSEVPPFPGRHFDVVSAMGVLLHITDEDRFVRAVRNLAEQLEPDGAFVLLEPLVVKGRWARPGAVGAHNVIRTVADWESALAGTGLRIETIEPAVYVLSDPVDGRSRPGFALNGLWWRTFAHAMHGRERLASVVMPPLALIDRALARLSRTGPSTKCVVLRRSA